ncbi:MAG: MMPL family transporter [Pseudomonadota bacterium]
MRWATALVSRRGQWAAIAVWIALAAGLGQLQPKLADATENDTASFLPSSAESTEVSTLLSERFRSGGVTPAFLVGTPEQVGDGPGTVVAAGGDVAYRIVPLRGETAEELQAAVDDLRDGTDAYVTGPAGLLVDAIEVFGSIDATLLIATSLLVLVLLVAIYRSPFVALVPLVVVAIAYAVTAGIVYLLATQAGLGVNGQATGILIILMFGAGTDYCLLLVARFREELGREPDARLAMGTTVRQTAPAILSSGGTVALGLLVLVLADFASTRTIGWVSAIGILVTMAAGLTLLPAILLALGRRAFWPAVPRAGEVSPRSGRVWRRIGGFVGRRPWVSLAISVPLLFGTLGNLVDLPGLALAESFRGETESAQGVALLERAVPGGVLAPTDVVAPAADADRAAAALRAVDGVLSVRPAGRSDDGGLARLTVTLEPDPYSDEAIALVDDLRAAVPPGTLVGGATAEEADGRSTSRRDFLVIAPVALAVIFVVLVLLLRSLVAPLVLVASQVLTFAATLGLAVLSFRWLFDSPGSDASLPTLVFVFTVALGIDYSIFLMARVREEVERRGSHHDGVVAGLVGTGGVITSAGVILAGTFLVLMLLPLEPLFQLGFAIAVGVVIDTFVVRTLVVPAAVLLLGRRTWWPGALAREQPQVVR